MLSYAEGRKPLMRDRYGGGDYSKMTTLNVETFVRTNREISSTHESYYARRFLRTKVFSLEMIDM